MQLEELKTLYLFQTLSLTFKGFCLLFSYNESTIKCLKRIICWKGKRFFLSSKIRGKSTYYTLYHSLVLFKKLWSEVRISLAARRAKRSIWKEERWTTSCGDKLTVVARGKKEFEIKMMYSGPLQRENLFNYFAFPWSCVEVRDAKKLGTWARDAEPPSKGKSIYGPHPQWRFPCLRFFMRCGLVSRFFMGTHNNFHSN